MMKVEINNKSALANVEDMVNGMNEVLDQYMTIMQLQGLYDPEGEEQNPVTSMVQTVYNLMNNAMSYYIATAQQLDRIEKKLDYITTQLEK